MACAGKELLPSSTFDLIPNMVAGRTMVLLQKIPDGCIQALENYRSAKSSAKHLSVLWNGNAGEMKIVTGEEEKDRQLFAFSTIAETTGKASAAETSKNVEDILRTSSQKRQQLQAVGTVTCKVKVKARDTEVFQRTRNSVRSAEEKWRGVRTREMDIMDARGTKGGSKNLKNNGTKRPTPTVSTSSAPPSVGRSSSAHHSTGMKKSSHSSLDSASMSARKVDQKSLRGMLTYILAPKPLKKSDILSRLAKADKNKKSDHRDESRISSALDSIATQSHDQYHLKPALLTGLQVSQWSHYSDAERQVLVRKLKSHTGDGLGASSSVNGASLSATSRTSTPSPSEHLRSPFRSVAGLVDELGLTNEKSPSSQLTPLAQGHIRTARQQQQQQQQSHHQHSASSSSIDDSATWMPVTMDKLKHNSTPALRRATLSKSQANMLTATSKARHASSSASKSSSRLKTASATCLSTALSPSSTSTTSTSSSSSAANSHVSSGSSGTSVSSQPDTGHTSSHASSHTSHRTSQHSTAVGLRSSNRSVSISTSAESTGNTGATTASVTSSSSATSSTVAAATTTPSPMSTSTTLSKGKGMKRHRDPRPSKQEPEKKRRSASTPAAFSAVSAAAPAATAAAAAAGSGGGGSGGGGGGGGGAAAAAGSGGGGAAAATATTAGASAAAATSHRKSTSAEPQINVDEDWKSKYLDVTSYAIRCSYKNDFNSAYPIYCQLKNKMDKVMGEFQSLEEQWKDAEGTPEEDRVYERVISLHEKYMKDSTFKFDRQKLQFLHNKLSHIKSLIGVYDSQLLAQS